MTNEFEDRIKQLVLRSIPVKEKTKSLTGRREKETSNDKLGLVKPFYTMRDMAEFLGYNTPGVRKVLFKMHIPISMLNERYIVYLSDLQTEQPKLYASILEAEILRQQIALRVDREYRENKMKGFEEEPAEREGPEEATKNQFM
jgi:hypothetical protein